MCLSLIKLKCHWPSEAQNRNENMFGIMEFKLIPSTKKRNALCSDQRKIRWFSRQGSLLGIKIAWCAWIHQLQKPKKKNKIYKSSKKRLVRKGNFLVFIQKQVIMFQGAGFMLFLFSPILTTCTSLNTAIGTQINSLCRCTFIFSSSSVCPSFYFLAKCRQIWWEMAH